MHISLLLWACMMQRLRLAADQMFNWQHLAPKSRLSLSFVSRLIDSLLRWGTQ